MPMAATVHNASANPKPSRPRHTSRGRAATKDKSAATTPLEELRGQVNRAIFHNAETGYSVLAFALPDGQEIKAVGSLVGVRNDTELILRGRWREHPVYGRQFAFESYEVVMPSTRDGVVAYLANVAHGIGHVKAGWIVDALGERALDVIAENPEALYRVPRITREQADEIITALAQNRGLAELTALICREGVTANLAARIYKQYGAEALELVKSNPYILADEMWGVGFITADKVARSVGIAEDDPHRVEAVVQYVLSEAAENDGHCYLRPSQIVERVYGLLGKAAGITTDDMGEAVKRLVENGRLIRVGDCIYLPRLFTAEQAVTESLRALAARQIEFDAEESTKLLDGIQARDGIEYAPQQIEAVMTALDSPISIITGGPGTGKTTVINAVVETWRRLNGREGHVYLASPTGRAAKRLSDATGHEAKTIHRLLEYHPEEGFRRNADNPLPGPGLLVIDEVSMMDVELTASLLDAVSPSLQVVLVGDVDQLPSVGPGSVLRDCIESGVIPTVRLQFNYRQAGGSKVAEYAHWIVNGHEPPLVDTGDWNVRVVITPEEAADIVLREVDAAVTAGLKPMQFQVLCPQRKGSAGVNALNERIRELVNPAGENAAEFCSFRTGDKVMVVQNDYHRGVFNGDLGIVHAIADKQDAEGAGLYVDFDGNLIHFDFEGVKELTLAYATTVHKAQGSEFPLVIVVCTRQSYIMLQRNLLYTAVTRAKNKLVLIGQADAIKRAVANDRIAERNGRLAELLRV